MDIPNNKIPQFVQCEECPCEYVYFVYPPLKDAVQFELMCRSRDDVEQQILTKVKQTILASRPPQSSPVHQMRVDDVLDFDDAPTQQQLTRAYAVVPCLSCGHVQQSMFRLAEEQQLGFSKRLAFIVMFAGLLCSIIPLVEILDDTKKIDQFILMYFYALLIVCVGVIFWGIWSYFLTRKAYAAFDPNAEPLVARLRLAKSRAVLKAEYVREMLK